MLAAVYNLLSCRINAWSGLGMKIWMSSGIHLNRQEVKNLGRCGNLALQFDDDQHAYHTHFPRPLLLHSRLDTITLPQLLETHSSMDYLIRFIQAHETFRQPETNALAELLGICIEWVVYSQDVRSEHEVKGDGPGYLIGT